MRAGYKMVYKVTPKLYKIKAKLERHLCSVTDTLFNRQNRIVLFDLTNFYFEFRKDRTNVMTLDEKTTWDYYNLIRDIECTNRQLKTAPSLRPIYHQKDENSDAHLFFGLLAYWIVNTIRHQLQQNGVKHYWTEIVRMMSPQKIVTTEAVNALGEKMKYRICSKPGKDAAEIYKILHYKDRPFKKKKICSTQ